MYVNLATLIFRSETFTSTTAGGATFSSAEYLVDLTPGRDESDIVVYWDGLEIAPGGTARVSIQFQDENDLALGLCLIPLDRRSSWDAPARVPLSNVEGMHHLVVKVILSGVGTTVTLTVAEQPQMTQSVTVNGFDVNSHV